MRKDAPSKDPYRRRREAGAAARLPLGYLDRRVTGRRIDYWRGWLEHDAPDDPWWDGARHRGAVAGVDAPVHLLGGRYDLFLPGLLRDYARLRDAGRRPQTSSQTPRPIGGIGTAEPRARFVRFTLPAVAHEVSTT